jgi:1,4-dihydroxy-2-naphthoate octaprenyltransferase
MVGGTYYVTSGSWSWPVAWLSLLYACGPTAVLFGKHIDKIDLDAEKKVATLPVLLGEARARRWVITMVLIQYLGCLGLVLLGQEHWLLLCVFLNIPTLRKVLRAYRQPKPEVAPDKLPDNIWPLWFSAFAFDHTRKFTTLFVLALLIDYLFI